MKFIALTLALAQILSGCAPSLRSGANSTSKTAVNRVAEIEQEVTVKHAASTPTAPGVRRLTWDSSGPGREYRVYIGKRSRRYTTRLSVGPALSHPLTNLVAGQKYFFAVTSISNKMESELSKEIEYQAPE